MESALSATQGEHLEEKKKTTTGEY